MDGREGDQGGAAGARPLTRRELRAAQAAGTSAGPDAVDPRPLGDEPREELGRETTGHQTLEPVGPREADSWEAAVGWALRGELPAALPPEPAEPDDVRWEPLARPLTVAPPGEPTEPLSLDLRDLEPRALPPEVADDRRPWGAGADLWGDLADAEAAAPAPADDALAPADEEPGPADGQPRRVSVFGGAGGAPTTGAGHGLAYGIGLPAPRAGTPATNGTAVGELTEDAFAPSVPAPSVPAPSVPAPSGPAPLPTLDDLMATRPAPADGPAEWGWRGFVRRASGGLVAPDPGPAERAEREAVASVQRPLDGPRTIVVINPKGGAHKTTATLMLAATFGRLRGGYTLAWDNNETRGTLGWRSRHPSHSRTAVDLLDDLDRFADPSSSRVGDLDAYVRSQGSAQFDVLASDEDAASAASVDGFAFRALHRTLLRFYRLLVIDTGNNMRASNWQAAIEAADQVVVVSTMREDTAQSAAWALDALRATGHEEAVRRAVTVLSQPAPRIDTELTARLHDHFGQLTRAVLEVPYEPALVSGGPIDVDALSEASRRAWLRVAAAAADGL